jgi:hypothetical protein
MADRDTGANDIRVERLVDEALREIVRPQVPDLKARVMASWDARAQERRAGARLELPPARGLFRRPAAVVVAMLAVIAGAVVVWQLMEGFLGNHGRRLASQPETAVTGSAERIPQVAPQRHEPPDRAAMGTGDEFPHGGPALAEASSGRVARRGLVFVEFPLAEESASSSGPNLPGAPAGQLGDPLQPLPLPPVISIAPLAAGPTVSEMARPVSDFPVTDQQPGITEMEPGPTGGEDR